MGEFVRHNCGLVVTHTLHDTYSMIKSLQHRGREAAGIAAIGNNRIDVIKWIGPVNTFDVVDLHKVFPCGDYHTYMAHVRYATRGRKDKILEDAHPHTIGGTINNRKNHIFISDCEAAAVHNGQVNEQYLNGFDTGLLNTGCDTEALLHLYMKVGEHEILRQIPGSYTLAIAQKGKPDVVVLRDKTGIKPGVLGWKDGKCGVASEDIAFRKNGGEFIEDLDPGAVYFLQPDGGYHSEQVVDPMLRFCFFEWNYLADCDSVVNGVSVRRLREKLGEVLADEIQLKNIDLVTFLPRCPEPAARSYAKKTRIPFDFLFYKMRGERAFQGSTDDDREESIKDNLHLLPRNGDLGRKRVVVLDDSTVRGNNSRRERQLLYEEANVKEAYHLNYTPPIGIVGDDGELRGCLYGVDIPPDDKFIARGRSLDEISKEMKMHMFYISLEGMLQAFEEVGIPRDNLCWHCIGGPKPF
ncbi:MAG: hypothetical protein V1740_07590 [Candidatus Woesearchaeota archaeon]